ncbi:unnamed protein product, partial [Thelazia callipaeda]|uniref:Carboxypeptidase n=1 Tax=Thelazia callipaeda TaxID=103827 RepID=A0A0N5D9H1_THECL
MQFFLLLLIISNCYIYLIHAKSFKSDLITNLPGLTFDPGFKQLLEAENNPSEAPLLLWLNGGPGCSSLGGLFTELGPFRVNQDGETLFENIYTWNKGANVLYFESPYGTAIDNADALEVFFGRYPEYLGRPFFITGESYAGVYLPTLANILIDRIIDGTLVGVNFVGMAIGNGILSRSDQFNSLINLFHFRGFLGVGEFNSLSTCCEKIGTGHKPLPYCNFSEFLDWSTRTPKKFNDTILDQCATVIYGYYEFADIGQKRVLLEFYYSLDPYNTYQDCYLDEVEGSTEKNRTFGKIKRKT